MKPLLLIAKWPKIYVSLNANWLVGNVQFPENVCWQIWAINQHRVDESSWKLPKFEITTNNLFAFLVQTATLLPLV